MRFPKQELQKQSTDNLRSFERRAESHTEDTLRWRERSAKDDEAFSKESAGASAKSRELMEEDARARSAFLAQSLRRDTPSGHTPAREVTKARRYPRDAVQGTPDDERVRRYRQRRDLGAAMALKLEGLDDDDEEEENDDLDVSAKSGDSALSASTNVTESDVSDAVFVKPTKVRGGKMSRQGSQEEPTTTEGMMRKTGSVTSLDSEEVGYGSDRVSCRTIESL